MTQETARIRHTAAQAVLGGIAVALLTALCNRLGLDVATSALLNLIAVVLLSLSGNLAASALVSVAAMVSLHFFYIKPRGSWGFEDPLDIVVLAAFLFTALVITRLLSRLRASRNELRLAVDTIPALVWITRPDGSGEFSNARWLEYTGLGREEAMEWGYTTALHPEDYQRLLPKWGASFQSGQVIEDEARLRRADGEYRWFLHRAVPLRDARGKIVRWYGTSFDIEDRKQAQRLLRRTRERALRARFSAVLEERSRLAREIHDTLLQGFTGVSLKLVAAVSRLTDPPETVAALRDLIALAQKTLVDARRAVWDLRAPSHEGADFATALRAAVEECARGTGLVLDFGVAGPPRHLDPDTAGVVLRVAQEAVTNVVKHAGAETVRVRLAYGARRVRLSVTDDGRGFTVDPTFQAFGGHWGLLGMHERATQAFGKVRIRSSPGGGTRVVLSLPEPRPSG
jgi:PAS domain S-box-containing protein